MKKRLLMQLLAVVCVIGAYAYNEGDYIYSSTAKYKILGQNLVTNGTFNVGDGTEGWTNMINGPLDGDTWKVSTNVGPNGENAIESRAASADTTKTLHNVWQLPQGFYTVSYWVKAPENAVTSVTFGSSNYVDFFTNETGDNTVTARVATVASYTTNWSLVVLTVTSTSDETFLVFNANNIFTGTQFTGFEIHEAVEVYDTRIAQRYVDDVEKLLAEPDFSEGAEDILGMLGMVKEQLATEPEDGTDITTMINEFDVYYQEFLGSKAGSTLGTYLSGWNGWGYMNWNNMTARGTWTFEGGRWGFAPNVDEGEVDADGNAVAPSLERPYSDGYVASAGIQTGYTLEVGARIASGSFNNTSLKAGRYMFSVQAQAVASANKAAPYGENASIIIAEPTIWGGADSTLVVNDTLNGSFWKTYYKIFDITDEDIANGVEVAAGFRFPVVTNTGGRYSLRNPQFRVIGKTQEEVDHLYSYDQLAVQQNSLKARLDSCVKISAYTHAAGYPWGHKTLQDSIDKFSQVYNELLTVVDANGNELQPDKVTLEYKDQILEAVRMLNSAISNFYRDNKVYQVLIEDVNICNETLKKNGSNATFEAVIAKAQGMINATTVDADEMEAFTAMDDELLTAKEEYEKSVATRANPAHLYIKQKSLNFEPWTSSKTTYSADTNVNGWNFVIGADGKQWDISLDEAYEFGHKASIWRGTTVGPNGKAKYSTTITTPGVYEYRAKAYATDDTWAQYMNIAGLCGSILTFDEYGIPQENIPVDTLYSPNIRLFFGPEGALNDSITLTKCGPSGTGHLGYTTYTPLVYSVIYVKTTTEPEVIELGLEAFENGASSGANAFGFGDNRLMYLGSEAAYTTATDQDLNDEIANAKKLIQQYGPNDEKVGWIVYKLMRLVGDVTYPWTAGYSYKAPTTLQEKQNVYLTLLELEEMLKLTVDPSLQGIEEVETEGNAQNVRQTLSGVYSLTGAKVADSLQNLPKGIYIMNGKKYMVR